MTKASFVVSHEIMKRRKPFTDERISIIQVKDIIAASAFSAVCDELCDVSDTTQVVLLCRCMRTEGPKEETDRTRSAASCWTNKEDMLHEKSTDTDHIVSIATDRAPSMAGAHKGFAAFMKELKRNVVSFHCIIHQVAR